MSDNPNQIIQDFLDKVYEGNGELAAASFNEMKALKDATELIADLTRERDELHKFYMTCYSEFKDANEGETEYKQAVLNCWNDFLEIQQFYYDHKPIKGDPIANQILQAACNDGDNLIEELKQQLADRDELIDMADKYAKHLEGCSFYSGKNPCNCGLKQWLADAKRVKGEK